MNYKYLLCLIPLLFSTILTFSQSAATMLTNLDACPDVLLPYPDAPEDEYRERMVKEVLKLNMKQYNDFEKEDIEVYLRSLVIKSQDYNQDSTLFDFDNFDAEETLCKLYKWFLITEQLYGRNQEIIYNLERELHLKPIYQLKGTWSMRVWYFDTADNFYNIFDLVQKEDKTLKGDYLKISRDEKAILLDSFNLSMPLMGDQDEFAAKLNTLNLRHETDQSRLPFFLHAREGGTVMAIQLRKGEERHFFYYRDLEEYAEKERRSLTHRHAMGLLDLIKQYYGISMIPERELE